ncbi:MAG: hypothetical protein JWP12_2805 [Bacteroidetes bacterium]|nr:hypothetical protein [Bacteroidota bacterium]
MKASKIISIGAAAGIIFSMTWYLMARTMGFYSVNVYVYRNILAFALIIIGVILSIFLTKRGNGGLLEFKEAMKAGMLYSLILASIVALFNYFYYTFITPDTIDYFLNEAKTVVMADKKILPADYPQYLDAVRANYGSFRLIPPILFWGLIVSLITGALLNKKPPHTFSEN